MKQKVSDCMQRARSIMDEVIEEICDKYCKYPELWEKEEHPEGQEEISGFGPCIDCPLNRLEGGDSNEMEDR